MTSGSTLSNYDNPPLEEVACGCFFEPLEGLKLPHTGLYWSSLRKDFPTIEHVAPAAKDGEFPPCDASTSLPLPRLWFLNDDETRLIQFQVDQLFFNWRRRPNAPTYPRYPEVIRGFTDAYGKLAKVAAEVDIRPPKPTLLDLTYINTLVKGDDWSSVGSLSEVIKDFGWREDTGRLLQLPRSILSQATYSLPNEQGQLIVKLVPGRKPDGSEVYSLQISARGLGKDTTEPGMTAWFDMAHEWIVNAFDDLTHTDVQLKRWRKRI